MRPSQILPRLRRDRDNQNQVTRLSRDRDVDTETSSLVVLLYWLQFSSLSNYAMGPKMFFANAPKKLWQRQSVKCNDGRVITAINDSTD